MRVSPVSGRDGAVIGVWGCFRAVTEQEQAALAEMRSQQALRSVIDNTVAAISIRDRDFRFLFTNRSYLERFGLDPDEAIVGRLDTEVLGLDVITRLRVGDHQVLGGEPAIQQESVIIGGRERTLLSQRFPITDEHGQVSAIGCVSTDITDSLRSGDDARERAEWQDRIGRAIDEGRLLVYAQPIIDVSTGALWGEELLVRMLGEDGSGDVIQPGDFLPQAERYGVMPTIDHFMLSRAMELAHGGRRISVNVAPPSIRTPALADAIIAHLATDPAAAANLTFEITETAALASAGAARYFAACLAHLGSGLALDDFGTGYGSFTELRSLRLTSLKIDLSFVRNLAASTEDQSIVQLIIQMAKTFGLSTTAEGVEDAHALSILRELGVDRAQGYLIGAPAPVVP
ncbi:MAG: EAL domain-containing protein [Actinomycetota bacterium]|nr:EAL domain-containing protein [Actinomycetota bacterium]